MATTAPRMLYSPSRPSLACEPIHTVQHEEGMLRIRITSQYCLVLLQALQVTSTYEWCRSHAFVTMYCMCAHVYVLRACRCAAAQACCQCCRVYVNNGTTCQFGVISESGVTGPRLLVSSASVNAPAPAPGLAEGPVLAPITAPAAALAPEGARGADRSASSGASCQRSDRSCSRTSSRA